MIFVGGGLAVVAIIATVATVIYFAVPTDRRLLTISHIAEELDGTQSLGALRNASPALEEACAERPDCVEGYIGDFVTVTRYSSREAAAQAAAESAFEHYQSDWILVEYSDPTLHDVSRDSLERVLDETWASGL